MHLWYKKLGFCFKWHSEKMQVYQPFDIDIVPPACIFIKSKTLTKVLFPEFSEIFLPAFFFENETQSQLFSVNFEKVLRPILLQNMCKGMLTMIWSVLDSFVRFIANYNGKQKDIKDNCFLKVSM